MRTTSCSRAPRIPSATWSWKQWPAVPPAVVSDFGGPKSIVKEESCGFIRPLDKDAWLEALEKCYDLKKNHPDEYEAMSKRVFDKSRIYTLENAAKAQFKYFRQLKKEAYGI